MNFTALPPDGKDLHITTLDVKVSRYVRYLNHVVSNCCYLVAGVLGVNTGVGRARVLWVIQFAKGCASQDLLAVEALHLWLQRALHRLNGLMRPPSDWDTLTHESTHEDHLRIAATIFTDTVRHRQHACKVRAAHSARLVNVGCSSTVRSYFAKQLLRVETVTIVTVACQERGLSIDSETRLVLQILIGNSAEIYCPW